MRKAIAPALCCIDGCANVARLKGRRLCKAHSNRAYRYRLTNSDLNDLARAHCEICGVTQNLVVDHDHSCCPGPEACGDCNRGFLCAACNKGLGMFRDNTEYLQNAIKYLTKEAA